MQGLYPEKMLYLNRTPSLLQTIIKSLSQSAVQETLKYTTLAAIMTSIAWPLALVSGPFVACGGLCFYFSREYTHCLARL